MSCKFTEQVSYLIDGELPDAEVREVERHVFQCADCQQLRADFLNLRSQISSFESSATTEVQRRALARILDKGVRKTGPSWTWSLGPAAAAFATVLLMAVIAGVFYLQRKETVEPDKAVALASPTPLPVASPSENKPSEAVPTIEEKIPATKPERKTVQPRKAAPSREPKPWEQFAEVQEQIRAVDPQSLTAEHFEKTQTLLRAFRNLRVSTKGVDVVYERNRAKQLVYRNMMLRREADATGDVQSASLLENVEPILLDIANLPDKTDNSVVRVINERVERKNIVALLQVNSAALARALD